MRISICQSAIVIAAFTHCAAATTYQVGPTRTCTNLQAVVKLLAPGDVVEVDGDAIYPGGMTFDKDGTEAEKITIRGIRVNSQRPILSGANGLSAPWVVRIRADHYIFEGFDVTAGGDLNTARGLYNMGDDTTVRDTVVHDCPLTGISGAAISGSLTLHNVEVYHCGAETQDHQIYVESDNVRHPNAIFRMEFCFLHDGNGGNNVKSRVGRNEIYYNWIEGSAFHELDLIGADPDDQSAPADAVREDSDVVGNVFYKLESSNGAVARFGSDGTGASNGRYRFVNNTVITDRNWWLNYGIFKIIGRRESVEVHNNVFYRGGGLVFMVHQDPLPSGSSNAFCGANNWVPKGSYAVPDEWTGTIFGTNNPGFTDVTNFLLTPLTNSALFNDGILPTVGLTNFPFPSPLTVPRFLPPLRAPYTNNAVVLRPVNGAIDIGAFEQSSEPPVIVERPSILTQPQGGHIVPGSNATFSVQASGTPPLAYQWRFNGVDINGATGSSFTLANAQPGDTGKYSVAVSNIVGVTVSASASLLVLLDTNRPIIVISLPPHNTRLSNDVVTVSGVAADNVRVAGVVYQWNNPSALFVSANGTNNWSAALNLIAGTNMIRVKSVDSSGNESAIATRSFFYVVPSPLTVQTSGEGIATPNLDGKFLEIGKAYQLTASPATNWLFTHWSGAVSSTNATLNFLMQSNLVLTANFVTNPFVGAKGTYSGLFADTNGVAHQSGGFFSVTIKENGKFSGRLLVDGNTLSFSGNFNVEGRASANVSRIKFGKPPLNVSLDLDVENQFGANDRLYGTVSSDMWTSTLRADRAVWAATNPATSFSNRFTMIIPGGGNPTFAPTGSGYGLVTVDTLGKAKLSGALADGTVISQSATIARNGDWPIYVPLYSRPTTVTNGATITTVKAPKGCLLGWATVTNSTLAGTLHWIKSPIVTETFYPAGFTNVSALIASRYTAPPPGTRALGIVNGAVVLADGNLPSSLTNFFVLAANNAVTMTTANGALRLSLSLQTGRLSGTFVHPRNASAATSLRGTVLQNQNIGAGFFLGTNWSGSLMLHSR